MTLDEIKDDPVILCVDDEADVRQLLHDILVRGGYRVDVCVDGASAVARAAQGGIGLVMLDVSMPGMDGWATLEHLRDMAPDMPVIMLTAMADEMHKVRGLRGGADDYVTKPFGKQELLARVEAQLRRTRAARLSPAEPYADGRVTIEPALRRVTVDGEEVHLAPLEYRLLRVLTANAGEVVSRERLLQEVWGGSVGVPLERVKLYVGYVRRRLKDPNGVMIVNVRGFGYRWDRSA